MAVSNYKLCNLAARIVRFAMRRSPYDPAIDAVPKPDIKQFVEAAKQQLQQEQDQPAVVTIDAGTFDPQ